MAAVSQANMVSNTLARSPASRSKVEAVHERFLEDEACRDKKLGTALNCKGGAAWAEKPII